MASDDEFELRPLTLKGEKLNYRVMVVVPRRRPASTKLPLLILLHGLGETGDQITGSRAWIGRYGLRDAYRRLVRPPVARISQRVDWDDDRLKEVNASLSLVPYTGCVMVCPFTPNINRAPNTRTALDAYGHWIVETVIPAVQTELKDVVDPSYTAIDGCSLGGYVGLETFLRFPERFSAWGGVQSAVGMRQVGWYADRIQGALKSAGPKPLHIETSSLDPFREANEALSNLLRTRKIENELRVLPGPHDQKWLCESGTAEMLFWHNNQVHRSLGANRPKDRE